MSILPEVMENEIVIYTDGSCVGNPGKGGWGVIVINGKKEIVLGGGEPGTTNNRMEMTAILNAIKWMAENISDTHVTVYSDSNLLVQSLREGWKRKANLDIWSEIDKAINAVNEKNIKIDWYWIKAHNGDKYNEKVDKVAQKESKKQPKVLNDKEASNKAFSPITNKYFCNKCNAETDGRFSYMPDSDMIRLDCDECGAYIMFAEKTPENLRKAKKRVLAEKSQIEKIIEIKENHGEAVGEKKIKEIKSWTKDEAESFIKEDRSLF